MTKKPRSVMKGDGKVKASPTKKPKGIHPYHVQFGTRNEFSEVRTYPTAPKAKQAVLKELKEWQPWCQRFNHAGLDVIQNALKEADGMIFHRAPARMEWRLDEHTDTWLAVEFWQDDSVTST